ncbi:MAG: hypothetical protein J6126_04780, partial [Clostridia bacterium]|nr:hypothetical protein [Clostridia bacterium]
GTIGIDTIGDIYVGELMDYTLTESDDSCNTNVAPVTGPVVVKKNGAGKYAKLYDGVWYDAKYAGGAETDPDSYDLVWRKPDTSEVTGFDAIIANVTVGGLDEINFKQKVSSLNVSEVMDIPTNSILNEIVDADTTISDLSTASYINSKFEALTISKLMGYGILELDATTQSKLNTLFGNEDAWQNLNMSEFINALINLIPAP